MASRRRRDRFGELTEKQEFIEKQKRKARAARRRRPKSPERRREGPARVRRLTALEKDILKKAGIPLPEVQKRLERLARKKRKS